MYISKAEDTNIQIKNKSQVMKKIIKLYYLSSNKK